MEGKQIAPLVFENQNQLILPEAYENLFSTFIHAFRNAADHGIESPSARESIGKNPMGQIKVRFATYKHRLLIQISDDGGGIDPEKIREKLNNKGIMNKRESNKKIIQHIFDSQFSTKDIISETSGRGVGMDAIQFAAKTLGGKSWVRSTIGKGTTLYVCVPLIKELNSLSIKKAS